MEKHNSSPLAGRWNLGLIDPYRHRIKPQVLDEELWVHSYRHSILYVPYEAKLTADANFFQNLSLFKGEENREFTQELLYFPKQRHCMCGTHVMSKLYILVE